MKLPSAKASLIILAIIIVSTIVVVYSIFKDKNPQQESVIAKGISVENNLSNQNADVDSDGDGLLDWEESLWGTDPQRVDSDSDGTNDLEEIDNDRNPLIAGPDDKISNLEDEILSNIEQSSIDEDSLTNRVALGFAENYFNSREGTNLTNEQKNYLVEGISNQALSEIQISPIYSTSELETFVVDLEPEKLINYTDLYLAKQINILEATIKNYSNPNYDNLSSFIINKSKELMEIETPVLISKEHVDLANRYYQLGVVMSGFNREEEDPLYVMLSINIYRQTQIEIEDINNQIGNFLEENGIIIGDNGIEIENE